ncbi:MAG: Fic family protein [Enterobacterales bacterium]|nr:Fic family protein [Enterobacterales bacterium]
MSRWVLSTTNLPGETYLFFESYFSNFIEGTEFEIEEAEDIVFSDHVIVGRHADSHDVLNVFNLVNDYQEMVTVPETANDYIDLIGERHRLIMSGRKDKNPGKLKEFVNKAGSSVFVSPQKLLGTLIHGFKYYLKLPEGLSRAIYIQFLTSECHPFDDGNGRLSRIMLNAELVSAEQCKIIVPTVHRDSYLNGLRQATRQGSFRTLTKVFYQLQRYTASINWSDYAEARDQLEKDKANLIPDEGVATFNARIRQFKKTFLPT